MSVVRFIIAGEEDLGPFNLRKYSYRLEPDDFGWGEGGTLQSKYKYVIEIEAGLSLNSFNKLEEARKTYALVEIAGWFGIHKFRGVHASRWEFPIWRDDSFCLLKMELSAEHLDATSGPTELNKAMKVKKLKSFDQDKDFGRKLRR